MGTAEKVREKLKTGRLPTFKPEKLYGGHGGGLLCSACDQPILPAQIQYEFDVPDGGTFRFHVGCLGLWEGELMKSGWLKRPHRE
jgi:hypothetical protein